MPLRTDGISQLRMHRISIPGARYFITCVTKDRHSGLTTPLIWSKLLHHCRLSEADFQAVVCMPDHFHALFVLPRDTTPGSIVRTLKGPLTPPIRKRNLHCSIYYEKTKRPIPICATCYAIPIEHNS